MTPSYRDIESSESSQPQSKGVALVTGASRGIGRAIALRLADDGYDVAVNDLPNMPALDVVSKAIEEKGRRTITVPGDVSDEAVVTGIIQRTVRSLGSLDVVCVTGSSYPRGDGLSRKINPSCADVCRSADGGQCWHRDHGVLPIK